MDSILDEYEQAKHIKLPSINSPHIESYLNMDREYIEALSKDQCNSIAIELTQYGLYIQRLYNREKARLSFCNNTINKAAATVWHNYSEYMKYDMKIYLIAQENPTVDKAIKIRNHAQIRLDDLDGLARIIEHMAGVISRSGYGKE